MARLCQQNKEPRRPGLEEGVAGVAAGGLQEVLDLVLHRGLVGVEGPPATGGIVSLPSNASSHQLPPGPPGAAQ